MPSIDPSLPVSLRTIDLTSLADPDAYLMWGLLVDAAEALVLGESDPWRDDEVLAAEIRAWIVIDDPTWPFSFVNACAALGIDPAALRHELRPWLGESAVARSI
jgi:hypothetical protein